ncbi:NAD(P)-dependent oxidoreductase [Sphingomonas jatrophae]|uniref:3-hydroxyisobutyrate dehydrogenase n=1 Tax=Sphingomonas jatrophae TaxID=1166337 RepID=A0A1I6KFP5_9SPHN|nr:NAD(P)-dependent oxidoreductase [Sphingomonas jatrophae]SFR90016.1 3-hydroxyisobutyrate dehydrogenase [Sphingomonas jatrophae]
MRTGYVGLGNIGAPMAHRLADATDCLVHDVSPAAAAAFSSKAQWSASPAEMGKAATFVAVCVRDDGDVRRVVDGADGLLRTMRSGLIVIHSTVAPATVVDLAGQAAACGVTLLDAAVTGGPDGAARGELLVMVGGSDEAVAAATPPLRIYCSHIVHAGAPGAGMALKICNNLVTYIELAAALEAYRLADALGLDPEKLTETMSANGNLTPSMAKFIDHRRSGPDRIGREAFTASQHALVMLGHKDLALAAQVAADGGPALTTTGHVAAEFERIIMEGIGR